MSVHAILAPSSASRRMQCPGSRVMEATYPQAEDDPRALEGILAHLVNQAIFGNKPLPDGHTEEMLEGADLWMDVITKLLTRSESVQFGFEQWLTIYSVHSECSGTPDFWSYDNENKIIDVVDYKFGHRYVDVFENWQLLEYAIGVCDHIKVFRNDLKVIRLTIVQPRCYHREGAVRTWEITPDDLAKYMTRLQKSESESMKPDCPVRTGPECRDCSARHACTNLQREAFHEVEMSVVNAPFDLPANVQSWELRKIKRAIDILKARESGLENEVLAKLKQGTSIAGWRTEQGMGREKWSKPIDEVLALGQMMGVDIAKPSAITPKQAIKAGLSAEIVSQYSETPKGEIKLVEDDLNRARLIFKDQS